MRICRSCELVLGMIPDRTNRYSFPVASRPVVKSIVATFVKDCVWTSETAEEPCVTSWLTVVAKALKFASSADIGSGEALLTLAKTLGRTTGEIAIIRAPKLRRGDIQD